MFFILRKCYEIALVRWQWHIYMLTYPSHGSSAWERLVLVALLIEIP